MDINQNELAERTVWMKYLTCDNSNVTFDFDQKFAGVFCVREVSGYAVWYRRKLDDSKVRGNEDPESLDGEHLLMFFELRARSEAIEFAVVSTMPGQDSAVAIAHLNERARKGLRIRKSGDWTVQLGL